MGRNLRFQENSARQVIKMPHMGFRKGWDRKFGLATEKTTRADEIEINGLEISIFHKESKGQGLIDKSCPAHLSDF